MSAARRAALALLLLLLAVACGGSGAGHPAASPTARAPAALVSGERDDPAAATPAPNGAHCGYVRWKVKTGQDAAASSVDLHAKPATIPQLRGLAPPFVTPKAGFPPNYGRFPVEERTVRVTGTLVAYVKQQDDDDHLVIAEGRSTIIAEIPSPDCLGASPWRARIAAARAAFVAATRYDPPEPKPGTYSPGFVSSSLRVTVVGVVFFDFVHGQHGVAPNGVELHPVLSIRFNKGRPARPTASPSG